MAQSSEKKQLAVKSASSPNRGLVACLAVVFFALLAVHALSPKFPWLAEVSEEAGLITRVNLLSVDLEPSKDGASMVTVSLENGSKLVAREVSAAFLFEGDEKVRIPKGNSASGGNGALAIEPGADVRIPVLPTAEFLVSLQSRCPGCYLIGVGKTTLLPVEMLARICKSLLDKGRSCRAEYSLLPLIVTVEFSTVFGEKVVGHKRGFAYLSKTTETEYRVPKN